ncbi:MAG: hypothetical protein U0270_08070 [Labilithrix sp.]
MKARAFTLFLVLFSLLFVGCGDKPGEVKSPSSGPSLDDAFALLPGNAIAVGTVDARAFFSSETFGADLGKLVETYIPVGQEAGFAASKDVDRVTFASYSYQGVDVAAIIVGRFDEAKIKAAAANHTANKQGNYLVVSQYAGRDVYTINNIGFTLLSGTRAVAGTESGIRRVLERIKDNRVKRDITKWMLDTVETPGAAAAVAADFATQPMPSEAMRQVPLPFLNGMKGLRVLVQFKSPGTQVAGSMTYADEATAKAMAEQVRGYTKWAVLLSGIGVNVQNIDVKAEASDVQIKFEVDDKSLRSGLASLPTWIGPPSSRSPSAPPSSGTAAPGPAPVDPKKK